MKIDLEGGIVWKPDTDYGINKSGYVIHGCIHRARKEVACVLHTHTRAGMAVAAMKCGLLPLNQTSIRFAGHIGYHDYEGPAMAARTDLAFPSEDVLQKTAHMYQPGTRRPYGVLEWPAMLRLLAAEPGGYPPYWQ